MKTKFDYSNQDSFAGVRSATPKKRSSGKRQMVGPQKKLTPKESDKVLLTTGSAFVVRSNRR